MFYDKLFGFLEKKASGRLHRHSFEVCAGLFCTLLIVTYIVLMVYASNGTVIQEEILDCDKIYSGSDEEIKNALAFTYHNSPGKVEIVYFDYNGNYETKPRMIQVSVYKKTLRRVFGKHFDDGHFSYASTKTTLFIPMEWEEEIKNMEVDPSLIPLPRTEIHQYALTRDE